ncbi:MAG: radical SAM protein [Candidatus Methanomethyliaceae archaeon]
MYNRASGACLFTPSIKSERWLKPLYAQIALTGRCDRRCWWCYAESSPDNVLQMRKDDVMDLLDFLDGWGIFGVSFGGGEPFLHPDVVELVKYAWEKTGLDTSLTTNGYAPTGEQLDEVEGCVGEVRVSVRQPEDCKVLEKFLGRKFDVGVNLLLMKGNASLLEDLIHRCMHVGVKDFLINSFVAVGRGTKYAYLEPTEEDIEALAHILEHESATFKMSGRLARVMCTVRKCKFVPFSCEGKGRIIAITSDKKVKPSSLSEESYQFDRPEDIWKIYRYMVNGVGR